MCTERQHDSENIKLRLENARLKSELEHAHEQLHTRNTASNYAAWRITFQSSEAAAKAAFDMMMQAREKATHYEKMIDQGIA
ncbi:MAG: hypothetical protein R3204_17125 [Oceanospirillum sp.]|nr:hypothetical protein [Oceanospirillum sp.]